jgi:mannose-6-phosphate isomerase
MLLDIEKFSSIPLKLLGNRVWRSYRGGKLLEQWQGKSQGIDSDKPEEWIASVVEARNKNYIKDEGLSLVELDSETRTTIKLKELIEQDPSAFLGEPHVSNYGSNTAVLIKLLDSAIRLSIQVHPNKDYAREVFMSNFGKTEAWYIIGCREINGEKPYVLLGFKEGITREKWKEFFDNQDIDSMVNCLHKFYVSPGDIFLIEGGVPHAIGSGCFLAEIQEPTDYTMRVERTTFEGNLLPDSLCHQGVGFEKMLDCFNYNGLSREETLKRWYKRPSVIDSTKQASRVGLITTKDTECFVMEKLTVKSQVDYLNNSFHTIVVLGGSGELVYRGGYLKIMQGDMLFIPNGLKELTYVNSETNALEILICNPPEVKF